MDILVKKKKKTWPSSSKDVCVHHQDVVVCLFQAARMYVHACVCVCVCVYQRKTKDRADGMREKSAHVPSTGFEPVSLGCVCVSQ